MATDVLIIGDTAVARRVCATSASDVGRDRVQHLVAPDDADLARAVGERTRFAAILIRDDVAALRYALALAHLFPELPIAVTIFDRTISEQLQTLLPHAVVVSPAAAAVPSLLGPCLDATTAAAFTEAGDRVEAAAVPAPGTFHERRVPIRRPSWVRRLAQQVRVDPRHQDRGTRLMLTGLLGLVLVLAADLTWLVAVKGEGFLEAFSEAARVVATVGPGPASTGGLYGFLSAAAMLSTIVFTALFTAGLVDRLLEPRLIGLTGSATVPGSGHVIVVGLGQVGFRLAEQLRAQGHRVVGLERDRDAAGVALARQLKIPVVIGEGTSRRLLERLGVRRCLALAAVGSDDLDNVAVAVAVSAVSPSTRVVMRAGEQEAVSETRSLLPLGTTRDVTAIGAALVVARLAEDDPYAVVVAHDDAVHVRSGARRYRPLRLSPRAGCAH